MKRSLWSVLCLLLTAIVVSVGAGQNKKESILDPAKAGPDFKVQGEYEGKIADKDKLGAQVVARGDGKFDGFLFPGGLPGAGWDGKGELKFTAKTENDKVSVTGTKWGGTIADGKFTGKTAEGLEFVLGKVERQSPTVGAKPPEGAMVLFDGTSADQWGGGKLVEGNLLHMGVNSKKLFKDIAKLHVEFRCPYEPFNGGQGRGNSGVYMQGRWEVQVLDSFGLKPNSGDCGAMYSLKPPAVNMSLPPLTWQTYDIEYKAPKFVDGKGSLAVITVYHNGVKIHDNYEIKGSGAKPEEEKPGPIHLQNHGNPVYYRNIWVVEAK